MGARVLLVDDNPFDRELTVWALRKLPAPPGPVEVLCAASWDEARGLLASGDVDLLLLDYNLPGRTGLDIIRSEPIPGRPRVILVTGQEDVATATAALGEGVYDYVPKGLDWTETLKRTVARALETPTS